MHAITKRLEFCYGHRLVGYDGPCQHLHGHNAIVEIELRAASLDAQDMVRDFSEVRRVMRAWIDAHLDHRMILRQDDPVVPFLLSQGEPVFLLDTNPTAERLAQLIFERVAAEGWPVVRVSLWETPSSRADFLAPRTSSHDVVL